MLSRVADNLYWFGRYISRAENTARLVQVHANLILDMPRRVVVGWQPLIQITGSAELFDNLYDSADEANVVRFLLLDQRNPSSILSSLGTARTIARSARDILPREVIEDLNDLYLLVLEKGEQSMARRSRMAFLERIIESSLLIWGALTSNMSHDTAYRFLRVGARLEQADMTTRIIDVSAVGLLPGHDDADLLPFSNIQWRAVLMSLTGFQAYRRCVRRRVSGPRVVEFLLKDKEFPRALAANLQRIDGLLRDLPGDDRTPREGVKATQRKLGRAKVERLVQDGLTEYLDELQLALNTLHADITRVYFQPSQHRQAA